MTRELLCSAAMGIVGALAAGCVSQGRYQSVATRTAAAQLVCGADQLRVDEVKPWAYHAVGCGRDGWYRCREAKGKVCCYPAGSEEEARSVFAPLPYGSHYSGEGQVCEPVTW